MVTRGRISRWTGCFLAATLLLLGLSGREKARASSPPCRYVVTSGGTANGTVYALSPACPGNRLSRRAPTPLPSAIYCATLTYAGVTGWACQP